MPFPFEVPFAEIEGNLDTYVDEIFSCLQSEFLTLPKGPGFVEYPVFESGYEALKRTTGNFRDLSPEPVIETVYRVPITLIVLRCMLGFTPPEWAYVTSQRTNVVVSQGAIRTIDRQNPHGACNAPQEQWRRDGGTHSRACHDRLPDSY